MERHIIPAINLDDGKPLSPDEFQRLLYEYFEDRGILTDLRAHLRAQMIRALRDTSLGKTLMEKNKDISPKLQALNLLIAEYLLQRQYHYTLSVFSTEVPLSNIFPNISNEFVNKDLILKFRFTDNDMWDILETLGITKESDEGQAVYVAYKSDQRDPLLNCIIRTGTNSSISKINDLNKCLKDNEIHDVDKLIALLKHTGIKTDIALKIMDQIKTMIVTEMSKVNNIKNEELSKIKQNFDAEVNIKVDKYKRRLFNMENSFDKERKRLENELECAKSNLKECAQSLQSKYKALNKFNDELKTKEQRLHKQEEYLLEKEKLLEKQFEEVVIDKFNYKEALNKLQKEIKVKEKIVASSNSEKQERAQQTLENVNLDNVLLRQKAHQMQLEVNELRDQNKVYLNRIQEMASRTNTLMADLENSQQRIQELSQDHHVSNLVRSPMVMTTSPTYNYSSRYGVVSYNGGGEEGTTAVPVTPRQFRHTTPFRDFKRRLVQATSPDSSDEMTSTEAIIRETKLRLKNLEKESDKIDKHFKNFQSKSEYAKQKPIPETSASMMQEFQINVASIKNSLSRIFVRDTSNLNEASTSKLEQPKLADCYFQNLKEGERLQDKINSLIVDIPANMSEDEYDNVMKTLDDLDAPNQSMNSSGLLLATSISTINLSSDDYDHVCKDLNTQTDGSVVIWREVGFWNISVTCLFMFTFEMILLG